MPANTFKISLVRNQGAVGMNRKYHVAVFKNKTYD